MQHSRSLVLLLLTLLLLPTTSSALPPKTEVKIGVIAPLTLGNSERGQDIVNTLTLLGEELSKASAQYFYKFIFEDGQCGVGSVATTAVQKLINIDKVQFLITGCSGETLQAGAISERSSVLTFAVFASHPDVKKLGRFIFRTFPDQELSVAIIAKEATCLDLKDIALITEENPFTQAIKSLLVEILGDRISVSEDFLPESADFRAILSKVSASKPKVFYFMAASPSTLAHLVKQAHALGLHLPRYAFLHPDDAAFKEIAGSSAEGLKYLGLPEAGASTKDFEMFMNSFQKRFGHPHLEFLVRTTYDALTSISAGIESQGPDPVKVRDFLESYHSKGATGDIRFDEAGDLRGLQYVLKEVGSNGVTNPIPGCLRTTNSQVK